MDTNEGILRGEGLRGWKRILIALMLAGMYLPLSAQWLAGYEFRKQLTVDGADIPGSVTNFPLLINITDGDLQAQALASGFDIVFTDDDGTTQLNHELQSFNSGTGELYAWVQITLTAATDKNIYVYFGNSSILADQSTTNTWDANFDGVYHMEAANPVDATANGFDLTAVNGAALTAGNIGSAMQFDGNNDYLNFGSDIDLLRNVNVATISAWIRPDDITTDQVILGISRGNATPTIASRASIELQTNSRIRIGGRALDSDSFEAEVEDAASFSSTGVWHYFTGTLDYANKTINVYVDGVQVTTSLLNAPNDWTAGPTSDTPARNGAIGAEDTGGSAYFDGLIDEVRISNTLRSADWISITYNNLDDPGTFIKEVSDLEDVDAFLNGYTYRKRITIDNNDVYGSADLLNFPFLVSLTDLDLRSTGNGGSVESTSGYDIVFTSSTGVAQLNHQVEKYDPATGEYIAWVQIPRLKYNEDTEIYIYYGRTGASDPSTTDTWTTDYEAIFHMDDETTITDAHDNSTVTNNGATETTGIIGTALDFDDDESDYIDLDQTYHSELGTSMTLSGWINVDDVTQDNTLLGQFSFPPESSYLLWMDVGGSGVGFAYGVATNGSTIDKVGEDVAVANIMGNWKYVVGTWDGSTMTLYVDGNVIDSKALAGTLDAQALHAAIGSNSGNGTPGRLVDGQIDEVRISTLAKSADWIRTEYYNQLNPSSTYTVSDDVEDPSPDDYTFQKQITIDSDRVFGATPHLDFPFLISFTDADLRSVSNGGNLESENGYDLLFTAEDEITLLDHQLESYDPTTGEVVAWVRIPSLSPAADTEINLFYGRSGATNPSTTATWNSDYLTVYHMDGLSDYSGNSHSLVDNGAASGTGIVGGAYSFDASGGYLEDIDADLYLNGLSAVTVSSWIKSDVTGVNNGFVIADVPGGTDSHLGGRYDSDGALTPAVNVMKIGVTVDNGGTATVQLESSANVQTTDWQYVSYTWSSGNVIELFIDGEKDTPTGLTAAETGTLTGMTTLRLGMGGKFGAPTNGWDGLIDEFRISSSIRSDDWIKTEYFNMNDPATSIMVTDVCVDPGSLASPDTDLLSGGSTIIYLADYQSGTTLQWQSSTDGIVFTDIPGETGSSLSTVALTQRTYYRVAVTSSACTVNSQAITVFVEPAFLTGYCYRKRVTIDHTQVIGSGTHTDFPILVSLTDPDLRSTGNEGYVNNTSGFDIRFADDTGAALDHELELYDQTSGELVAWVRIPSLSAVVDTDIFMHFGNTSIVADQSTAATWSSDYKAIYHLNDNFDDATGVNDATEGAAGATNDVAGVIGRGRYFTGAANSWATAPNDPSIDTDITSAVTVQAWAKVFTPHPVDAAIVVKTDATNQERYMLGVQLNVDPGSINARVTTGTGHYRYDDGNLDGDWHLLTMTYDASLGSNQVKVYMDGSLAYQDAATGNITSTTDPLRLGVRSDGRQLTASVDEIRVLNVARSADWLATEYNNQSSPSTFYSLGDLSFTASSGLAQAEEAFVFVGGSTNISLIGHSGTIQWQQSTDNSNFTDIGGEVGASLTTPTLTESTYFRAQLSNGSCENFSNTILVEVRSGFVSDYSYRKQITIDPSNVPSSTNLTDFPLLINLTDDDLSTAASKVQDANGYDIIFTDLAGTTLDHDLELYDGTDGTVVAWVRIPTLFANAQTSIYMYYGNCGYAGGDQSSTGTWVGYNGVWHLDDDDMGGTSDDRTANGNDGTLDAFDGDESVDAFIGKGFDMDGTNDRVLYGSGPLVTGANTRTVEMWANIKNFDAANPGGIFTAGNSGANDFSWRVSTIDDQIVLEYDNLNYTYQVEGAKSNWHHYALTYDGATIGVFIDGVLIDQVDEALNTLANGTDNLSVKVASWAAATEQLTADEFRISNVARSEDWMATQYRNQSDPSNFLTIASEEIEWVWRGTADTDWTNATNWGGCNVPASGSDITISGAAPNFPALLSDLQVGLLNIESGASINVGTSQLSVTGTILNEGTLTASAGTVVLEGSNVQYLTGGGTYAINNLSVNKTGGKVVFDDPVTVEGTLDMTSGFLEIKDDQLTLGSSATIANAGHTSFILTTGSACLNQQGLDTGKGATIFPVGVNRSSYSPATITNIGTLDDFCVRLLDEVLLNGESGSPLTTEIVTRTWLIDEGTAGGSDVTLKLQWNSVEEAPSFDRTQSFLSHYNSGGFWEIESASGAAVAEGNNSYSRTAANVDDFSPFTLGSGSSPLPVELLFFRGEYHAEQVLLSWATASEIDNDFFTIEKSVDGSSFEELGLVPGQGTTDVRVDYSFVDHKPLPGLNYYRLKQTDYDGTFTYSEVVVVSDNRERTPELSVYPNANDGIDFFWSLTGLTPNAALTISLYDLGGNTLQTQQVFVGASGEYVGRGFANVTLQPGVYLLKALHQGEEMVTRILVR